MQIPTLPCFPWRAATWGTTDYLHSCANPNEIGVPDNDPGWQPALSGEGYIGFILKALSVTDYREYLLGPLNQPLIGGKYYYISFYVSLANERCGLEKIGAYFSVMPPPYVWGDFAPLDELTPQVESSGTFLNDTLNWMLIEGCFRASGGEAYVTIGNFHNNANTPLDPLCSIATSSYYYLDDIYIAEVEPGALNLDLGGPETECYSYEIDPGISGVDFYWSTGSTEPSITVTSSGNYVLTIYDGCDAGVDSIDVLITNQPPVELIDDITICQGESVSFSLDPDAGEYVWNDGSTSGNYTISTTGFYEVTLDDGCDITSDDINVTVLDPPSPFSIGGDTLLCTGSEIEIFLDPGLGEFLWNNNSNSNFFIINSSGTYAVTISNMCGEASAELFVEETTPAYVQLGPNADTLCNGETLDFSLDPVLGPYLWQDGSTSPIYQISTSGLYSVTMSHYCGASADSILVTALSIPVFDLGNALTPCPGDTLMLTVNGMTGDFIWQDGSTNDSLTITTSGVYALTIENACGVHNDNLMVQYQNMITPPDLGPDFSLCPGEDVVLSAGSTGLNYWWQDSSTADTLLIAAAGTYHVTVSNDCFSFSDTVNVSIENEPPTIILPDQLSLCEGSVEILDPVVSGVTYMWNNGSPDPTLLINTPGTYSLTVSNACGTDADTVIVLDGGSLPFITLGVDTVLCPGEMFLLEPEFTNVDFWNWSDGSSNPFLMIVDSGTVHVVVSNSCGSFYDTVYVKLLEATPLFDLGSDAGICPGESISLTISYPDVDILWSDGSMDPQLIVNSEGTFYATISNECGSSSDTINVQSLPGIPALDLGSDLPLCPGELITITPGLTGVEYLWQDGSTDSFFLVDYDQMIVLSITNTCGVSVDTLIVFTNTDGPDVELGENILACEGETVTINANISGVDYLWQDASTGPSFITTQSGIFYLQVTNSCGMDSDTIQIDINGLPPSPDLGLDTILCEGNIITLVASSDPETTTTWQDGSNLPTYLVNSPGTYFVMESNRCGESSDTIQIGYQPLPLDIDLGPDEILCPGETLLLSAPVSSDQIKWQDGSSSQTFLVSQAGHYSLTVSNNCGMSFDEIEVFIDADVPDFLVENQFALCAGEQLIVDVTQSFPSEYIWNTGSNLSSITIFTPGAYAVTVITECQEWRHEVVVAQQTDCTSTVGFYIPDIISPNNDGINDQFVLYTQTDIEILSIEGSIFDRWGNLVYSSSQDPFIWNGRFGDEDVLSGVFVYKIQVRYVVDERERSKLIFGDLTVIR